MEKKPSRSLTKVAYFNRELSWLAFNRRVLEQAIDESYPVLERLKFLSFVSSNLDEFFEIRVSGLIQQVDSRVVETGPDGLGPKEQLRRIHDITNGMVSDKYKCWHTMIVPELAKHNLIFKGPGDLTAREAKWVTEYFENQVYPVITPLAIDPSHPFPQIGNKTLNILVCLDDPNTPETETIMAIIPVPRILPRVVEIGASAQTKPAYIFLSDILKMFADRLFPGYKIRSANAFRITRNSDLYIDEEEIENLLHTIEEELYKLRKGAAVRLEIEEGVPEVMLADLLAAIKLGRENVFLINGPINLSRLMSVYDLIDRPDLKFKPFVPVVPVQGLTKSETIFDMIARDDILLHHPYDSFGPVVDFIQQAARDPNVLAIKLTLYRTSSDSPIVKALMDASHNGKQVTALIELKARFDEAQNILWAKRLEEAGVHVVYGMTGMKTHCKCCLIVRREKDTLRRYVHLGTGNYNPKTARLYTDLSLLTCREEITEEVHGVFNTLTGFAISPEFKKLLVAPYNLHSGLQQLIHREADNAEKGLPARIIMKCNSLVDKETIDNLYLASQAGVQIDLIVRGICCLVPGVKGMSENIKVRSILGRYLEHSRIYYFENAESGPEVYMGSADWMPRNFFRRIEVVAPIENATVRKKIIDILDVTLRDTKYAKFLRSNGAYYRLPSSKDAEAFSSQEYFIQEAEERRASFDSTH